MRTLVIIVLVCCTNLLASQCDHPDYDGLMKIFNDYNGDNWIDNTGWTEGILGESCDPCDFNGEAWHGVICREDGRVKTLTLYNNGLSGELKEITGLDFVTQIRFNQNNLTGSVIDFENLPFLTILDLSDNQLEGSLPDFSNVNLMQQIFINDNNLTGTIPDFGHFNSIRVMEMENNNLSGSIPNFSNMDKLRNLRLNNNLLEGEIPDFSNCPDITRLYLSNNHLSGQIPAFEELTDLLQLELQQNMLSGTFPDFGNHKIDLITIDFSYNQLSGNIEDLSNLSQLEFLYLGHNNFDGPFSFAFTNPSLEEFTIEHNFISDTLPPFWLMSRFKLLDIGNNLIAGEITFDDLEPSGFSTMFIDSNDISGCLPVWYCLNNKVHLGGNPKLAFSGNKPELCNGFIFANPGRPCDNGIAPHGTDFINDNCECISEPCGAIHQELETLIEFYNATGGENWTNNNGWHAGSIGYSCDPCNWRTETWFGVTCENNRVVCIDLDGVEGCTFSGTSGNNLQGEMPELELEFLRTLILDNNNLTGTIPNLDGLPSLERLWLAFNQLSGEFPSLENNLEIQEIRCSHNLLEGQLPDFNVVPALQTFTAANNFFTGCYPSSLCELELYDLDNNPFLPWDGDASKFCEGEEQLGAPCNGNSGTIQNDCICSNLTSVIENDKVSFLVFPNPASDKLSIEFEFEFEFKIFDLQGQLIINASVDDGEIDISMLNNGLYYLRIIRASQEVITSSFVKSNY